MKGRCASDHTMRPSLAIRTAGLLCALCLGVHAAAAAPTPASADPLIEALRERVEALAASGRLSVEGTPLSATRSLAKAYELHGFQPFWDAARLAKLLEVVRASVTDGLTPADYHLAALHDTPSQALFEREQRAFSSGCIRTERPLELAELLLANPERWNRAAIDAVLDSGTTRTIRLPKPVPMLILYWTIDRDEQGAIVFKPDAYGRDPKLLKALDRPFLRPDKER